jgi:DNA-binding MarR family transcriptional regulator
LSNIYNAEYNSNMEMNSRQVCEDLLALLGSLKAGITSLAETYSLTSIQIYALYSIFEGATTMGHVAEMLHCDASNVTGVIDRLVAQNLVQRAESATDRRAKLLTLTAKGQKLMDSLLATLPARMGYASLSDEEGKTLHEIVAKLAA